MRSLCRRKSRCVRFGRSLCSRSCPSRLRSAAASAAPPSRRPRRRRDEEGGADVVIVGRIRTLDPRHPEATGLVIRGGVVLRTHVGGLRHPLRELADEAHQRPARRRRAAGLHRVARAPAVARPQPPADRPPRARPPRTTAAAMVAEAAKNAAPGAWILGRGLEPDALGRRGMAEPHAARPGRAGPPGRADPRRRPRVVGQHAGARARGDQQGHGRARRRRDHARPDGRADGHPRRQRDGRGPGPHRAPGDGRRGRATTSCARRRRRSRTASRRSSTAARAPTSCCS